MKKKADDKEYLLLFANENKDLNEFHALCVLELNGKLIQGLINLIML